MNIREALYNQLVPSFRGNTLWSQYFGALLSSADFSIENLLLIGGSTPEVKWRFDSQNDEVSVNGKLRFLFRYTFLEGVRYTALDKTFYYLGEEVKEFVYSGGEVYYSYKDTSDVLFTFLVERNSSRLTGDLRYKNIPRNVPIVNGSWLSLFYSGSLYGCTVTTEPALRIPMETGNTAIIDFEAKPFKALVPGTAVERASIMVRCPHMYSVSAQPVIVVVINGEVTHFTPWDPTLPDTQQNKWTFSGGVLMLYNLTFDPFDGPCEVTKIFLHQTYSFRVRLPNGDSTLVFKFMVQEESYQPLISLIDNQMREVLKLSVPFNQEYQSYTV